MVLSQKYKWVGLALVTYLFSLRSLFWLTPTIFLIATALVVKQYLDAQSILLESPVEFAWGEHFCAVTALQLKQGVEPGIAYKQLQDALKYAKGFTKIVYCGTGFTMTHSKQVGGVDFQMVLTTQWQSTDALKEFLPLLSKLSSIQSQSTHGFARNGPLNMLGRSLFLAALKIKNVITGEVSDLRYCFGPPLTYSIDACNLSMQLFRR